MKARDTKKAIDGDSRWNTKQENKKKDGKDVEKKLPY
jgi:hypothetical protein